MLTIAVDARLTRWAAGLIGCVLVALGFMALRLRLAPADPLIAGLAVCVAAWLVWVAVEFALARAAHAMDEQQAADAFGLAPEFVDTLATWTSPGQALKDAAGPTVRSAQSARRRDAGRAIDADG